MNVQLFFKPEQVIKFFESLGFEVKELSFGKLRGNKWIDSNEPAVIYEGKFANAELLWSRIANIVLNHLLNDPDINQSAENDDLREAVILSFNEIYKQSN